MERMALITLIAVFAQIVQTLFVYIMWLILFYAFKIQPPDMLQSFAIQFVFVCGKNFFWGRNGSE